MKTYSLKEALRIRNERSRRYRRPYIVDRVAHGKWIVRRQPAGRAERSNT